MGPSIKDVRENGPFLTPVRNTPPFDQPQTTNN